MAGKVKCTYPGKQQLRLSQLSQETKTHHYFILPEPLKHHLSWLHIKFRLSLCKTACLPGNLANPTFKKPNLYHTSSTSTAAFSLACIFCLRVQHKSTPEDHSLIKEWHQITNTTTLHASKVNSPRKTINSHLLGNAVTGQSQMFSELTPAAQVWDHCQHLAHWHHTIQGHLD